MLLSQYAHDLFGVTLSPEQIRQFEVYTAQLAEWNAKMNLTAIVEPEAVEIRHFLDSLSVVKVVSIESGMRLLDIGSGAGFPGVPLHIAIPGISTTLLEATGKKVTFLNHLIETLGLTRIKTLNARAEEAAHISHHRGSYDRVLARAVARLPGLVEYMLPFVRMGGYCIAMKGATAQEEARDAEKAIEMLGGKLIRIESVQLPNLSDEHYLIVIEKVAKTGSSYPRKPGIPTRKPLGIPEEIDPGE
ncbi:MAG: 16S rRNA (guanine(527)-N(7))-methyltransferase RsmG [Anaerolineae bacterium]|jgi:16S rRNA (guanine527-N7)-methyltransferase|nr:16S rRNA (guanine(527)-N(7))-methyltransferase RsmG [Anaerolineae bacterium]